jgi:hypothetical protein
MIADRRRKKKMKKNDPDYGMRDYKKAEEIFEQEKDILVKGRKLTKVVVLKGIGTVKEYGELDLEKLVKRLLKSDAIKNS